MRLSGNPEGQDDSSSPIQEQNVDELLASLGAFDPARDETEQKPSLTNKLLVASGKAWQRLRRLFVKEKGESDIQEGAGLGQGLGGQDAIEELFAIQQALTAQEGAAVTDPVLGIPEELRDRYIVRTLETDELLAIEREEPLFARSSREQTKLLRLTGLAFLLALAWSALILLIALPHLINSVQRFGEGETLATLKIPDIGIVSIPKNGVMFALSLLLFALSPFKIAGALTDIGMYTSARPVLIMRAVCWLAVPALALLLNPVMALFTALSAGALFLLRGFVDAAHKLFAKKAGDGRR